MKISTVLFFFTASLFISALHAANPGDPVTANLPPFYSAYTYATNLSTPRQMAAFPNGDVVVVQNGANNLLLLYSNPNASVNNATSPYPTESRVLTTVPNLQRSLKVYFGYLYSQNVSHIIRWSYDSKTRTLGPLEVVVYGIPYDTAAAPEGNRPTAFDGLGYIYVGIGTTAGPVDPPSDADNTARIFRYFLPGLPYLYSDGEVFASGERDCAALEFDGNGNLWGPDNGIDVLNRADLGGDIIATNPADKLNLYGNWRQNNAQFFGYPYCWQEYSLPAGVGQGLGTEWVDPAYLGTNYTDAFCRDTSIVTPAAALFPPHYAPLDFFFYGTSNPALPQANWPNNGDAFVAMHGPGSTISFGRRVVRVQFGQNNEVTVTDFFSDPYSANGFPPGSDAWAYAPDGLVFANCGGRDCLLIAESGTNSIIAVVYNGPAPSATASPSPAPSASRAPSSSSAPASPSASSTATTAPSCPSPTPSCDGENNDDEDGNTTINFYFADMLA